MQLNDNWGGKYWRENRFVVVNKEFRFGYDRFPDGHANRDLEVAG